ncbi:helix-turn-helix transcriptional regulator [Candidatus Stoquefichus sp. SB1]|uniref:helix-turn-helix transcriptional regulator n=1 Tax=Candidatus Stoquefichus sp. SB1 TaxID=1658109 RepID=UPI001E4B0FEA|nr:AraC family transcriptional regulator [Candidatus Stoquefichus sp. SB1]
MFIQTQKQYTQFESDDLTELLGQMTFKINNFGLWQSQHDTKVQYISNDIEIVYYREGGSITRIGNKEYECPPGSFLILEPYQLNVSINQKYCQYSYYYFHFEIEPLHLRKQFLSMLTKHGHLIYAHEMKDFREMLDRLLIEANEKEIGYSSIITSALIRVVVEIMRAQLKRSHDNHIRIVHSPYTDLVNEAIHYIQEHLYESIRLNTMAQDLGVSKGVLYKAFIEVLSIPPAQYIHQEKIQYVQSRLLLGESLTALAQELGYSSAYHLSKDFKKQVGVSPREYKKHVK